MPRSFSATLNQNCKECKYDDFIFINFTSEYDKQPDLRNITLGLYALLFPRHF